MPLGVVTDDEFEKELRNSNESSRRAKTIIKERPNLGRGDGNTEVPNSLRKIIGETATVDGRQEAIELAEQFGISKSSVSAYAVGATSTASYDKRPNESHLTDARGRVAKRARNKMLAALSHITTTKMEAADAKELSGVAKDMATIIKVMEPPSISPNIEGNSGPTFVFYAPRITEEKHFDIIDLKE